MEDQTQTAPTTEPRQSPEVSRKIENKKSKKKGLIIGIISALLVVGLGGVGYWYYENYIKEEDVIEEEVEEVEEPVVVEEENTKACISEKLGLKMEVPEEWTCEEEDLTSIDYNDYYTGKLVLNSDFFELDFIYFMVGGTNEGECTEEIIHENEKLTLKRRKCGGEGFPISNKILSTDFWPNAQDVSAALYVKYPDMENEELTDEKLEQLKKILDSIEILAEENDLTTYESTLYDMTFDYDQETLGLATSERNRDCEANGQINETIKFEDSNLGILINNSCGMGWGGGETISTEEYSLNAKTGQVFDVGIIEFPQDGKSVFEGFATYIVSDESSTPTYSQVAVISNAFGDSGMTKEALKKQLGMIINSLVLND